MSEQKVTLYHCTLTKYVPKILKKGILLMQRSNWVVSGTGERYGGGHIFAFDTYKDAVTWAMKWDWNLNDNFGTGQISIVEFLANPEDWSEDNSDPLTRYRYRGKWLTSNKRVPPEDIQNTVVCTESVIQAARSQNPAKDGVRIPAYLRTPKLKPYIEQGLITQEIVDLYESAIDAAKRFAEEEIELNKKHGEHNWVYPAVFHAVHGYSNRLLIAINNAKLDNERFPHFGNTGYRSGADLSSTFGQRLIQQARKKTGKRDDRRANPDDPNDTSWVPKRRAPLKRDYEDELESYDTEIKPISRPPAEANGRGTFKRGGGAVWGEQIRKQLVSSLESPLAKYAPHAAITRFRVEVPNNRVFVYGYDPRLRFGEGAFFCDLYQRFSDNDEPKKLVDIGWKLNDIGNNEVLSAIEDYDLSEYIPFEHLANLQRGKPFDRADNPSSRRANPEVSVELSPPARFEITKAFLEHEYTDVVERGYAIGYLRHLLYDTRKPETNEISQDRRTEIAKTVKAESENDD